MKKIFTLTVLMCVLSLCLAHSALAIGIISKPIDVQNAVRGETFQETLKILNSEESEAVYKLLSEGDIEGWATFYEVDDLETPVTQVLVPARDYYDVIVFINIPNDTPNGEYKGKLTIALTPGDDDGEGTSVSVSQKVSRNVSIKVTDNEIIKLAVSVIPQTYDLAKEENLQVRFIYDNQGNISLTPQIQFKIKKEGEEVYNVIYPYPDDLPAVKPLAQYEIPSLEVPTNDLKSGKYVAVMEFLHNGQSILTKDFVFLVGSGGSVLGLSNVKINWNIILLAGVIIFIILIAVFIKKNFQTTPVKNGNGNGRNGKK